MGVDLLLVALSGTLLLASAPPIDFHWLAWIALVPALLPILRGSALRAFLVPLAAWYLFDVTHARWMLRIEGIHVLNFGLPVVVHAAYFGVFGLIARWFHRRAPQWDPVTFPAAWVVLEYLRFHLGFLSFPWGILGVSQHSVLPVAGVAAITGVHGVSFLLVTSNTVLAGLIDARLPDAGRPLRRAATIPRRLGACAGAALGVMLLAAASSRGPDAPVPTLRVALVQLEARPPARPGVRRDELFERYAELTRRAAASEPELIAWSESSVRGSIPYDRTLARDLANLARTSGAYLLVGSSAQEKAERERRAPRASNSAFLIAPDGSFAGRYDKMRLLPFNEYLPLRGLIRWPSWIVSEVTDAEPGREATRFDMGRARFGVLICWENLFPDAFRRMAAQGVDFMVSMTNEAFIDSAEARHQMLAMNVFRAIENRVAIVRTATTGVSAIIEPSGRVVERIRGDHGDDVNVRGYLVGEVPLVSERTFYTRHGEWFVVACTGLLLIVAAAHAGWARREAARIGMADREP
ncbi:MAG: apolipoprotein N-acyltransferase [Deltaproteobacteria bacterium]|nr:MAG: apolipoprotein N-acyltransferase [Deltaproteobacteria bacterium]